MLEANIDDSSPQVLGYAMERLLEAGALDVTLDVRSDEEEPARHAAERDRAARRSRGAGALDLSRKPPRSGCASTRPSAACKARHSVEIATPHGTVRMKIAENGSFAPEYEDCRKLARESGVPLKQILAEANLAYLKNSR